MTGNNVEQEIAEFAPVAEGVASMIPGAAPYVAAAEAVEPAVLAAVADVQAVQATHAGTINEILAFLTKLFPGHGVPAPVPPASGS